jgi:hypothetical protein
MRKVALLIATVGLFVLLSPLATASGQPTRTPVPDSNYTATFPAGVACPGFALQTEPVRNETFSTAFPAEPNGDVRQINTGNLVERFTNLNTGKSIVVNASGQGISVFHADGSITLTGGGPSYFTDTSPANSPPGPATFLITGRFLITVTPSGQATLVSYSGILFDICAALS